MELNEEQRKLVEVEPKGLSLIKGVAGSGKTTVALHRALFLHRQYCIDEDRVLFATFNRTLINYLQHIYEQISEKYKEGYANIFSDSLDRVDIVTVDQIIYHYYNNNFADVNLKPLFNNKLANQTIMECIRDLPKKSQGIGFLGDSIFLQDEISWIKSCGIRDIEEYQVVDRIGRTRPQGDDLPQRLPKNSEVRKVIYNVMLDYDRKLQEQGYIHPREMAARCLDHARQKPTNSYRHIIIDEGQDLTRVQLEFLQTVYKDVAGSSFTLVIDVAQSIYTGAWLIKGRSLASVGLDMMGKSSTLSKNYRTSTQVAQAAYSMLEKDSLIAETEGFVSPSLLDRQGAYPVLRVFQSEQDEARQVVNLVKKLLNQKYEHTDIAIIARMKKQLNQIKECFDADDIPNVQITTIKSSFEQKAIRLLTMHAVKGLEYPVVIIVGLNKDIIPYLRPNQSKQDYQETNERKLLYVGMTRAVEQLYLSCWGNPSKFVGDINPEYLRISSGSRIKRFYKVDIDNYYFKNEIRDLYSPEEEVRQWIVSELTKTYHYPKDLIELEYKVSLFSKPGSVDVVVNAFQDGNYSPYIVIEAKAPGVELSTGLQQLKSYMAVLPKSQYGLLTNGNELIIINKNHDLEEDIPSFRQSMMPSGNQVYKYNDLRSKQSYNLLVDCDSTERIVIETEDEHFDYSGEQITKVPIFNKVAAGDPCLMDECAEGYFCLPSNWYANKAEVYILKVKGDSMIDVNINDGDLVVVEKSDSANNRDIVVVAFDDESVIKRYTAMGNTVLLISENENYEPIHVRTEQARILGVAIGVIHQK